MAWFKVDDGFWSHPKTATLSDSAVALWVRAGAYSCQHLTDGVIARAVLRLVGTEDACGELVRAGLWLDHPDGWEFHDWDLYQPDAASQKAKRHAESEAGTRGNHLRWHVKRGIHVEGCQFCSESGTQSGGYRVPDQVPDQVPNREPDRVAIGSPESPPNPPVPDPYPYKTSSSDATAPDSALFDQLWNMWPSKRRGTRKKSGASFRTALKAVGGVRNAATILDAAKAHSDVWRTWPEADQQFVPAMTTWLNQERWTLEPPESRQAAPTSPQHEPGGPRVEFRDGIRFVNGKPTMGGPQGMTREQFDAWKEAQRGRRS